MNDDFEILPEDKMNILSSNVGKTVNLKDGRIFEILSKFEFVVYKDKNGKIDFQPKASNDPEKWGSEVEKSSKLFELYRKMHNVMGVDLPSLKDIDNKKDNF